MRLISTQRARDNKQTHVSLEATPAPTTLHRPMPLAACRAGYRPTGKISPPLQWMWLIYSPDLPAVKNCLIQVRVQTVWNGASILLEISRNYRTARLHLLRVEGALADVQAQLGDTGKRTCGASAWCRKTCCGISCADRQSFADSERIGVADECFRVTLASVSAGFRKPFPVELPQLFACSLHDCTHNTNASILFPLSPY